MRRMVLGIIATAVLAVTAHQPPVVAQTTAQDVQKKTADAWDTVKSYSIEKKKDAVAYGKKLVRESDAKIKGLENKAAKARSSQRKATSKEKPKNDSDPMPLLEQAFDMAVQEDGWARLDLMGNALYQLDPGFDPRTYGQRQLSRLIKSLKDAFEMRSQEMDGSTLFLIKMKE